MTGTGTAQDPWQLTTAPGSSAYTMYRDESVDPAELVCVVGSTTLKYQARTIVDLHSRLFATIDPAHPIEARMSQASPDLLRERLTLLYTTLVSAEVGVVCGAAFETNSPNRTNHRNGYRILQSSGPTAIPVRAKMRAPRH